VSDPDAVRDRTCSLEGRPLHVGFTTQWRFVARLTGQRLSSYRLEFCSDMVFSRPQFYACVYRKTRHPQYSIGACFWRGTGVVSHLKYVPESTQPVLGRLIIHTGVRSFTKWPFSFPYYIFSIWAEIPGRGGRSHFFDVVILHIFAVPDGVNSITVLPNLLPLPCRDQHCLSFHRNEKVDPVTQPMAVCCIARTPARANGHKIFYTNTSAESGVAIPSLAYQR